MLPDSSTETAPGARTAQAVRLRTSTTTRTLSSPECVLECGDALNAPLAPLDLECYHAARMGGLVKAAMQVGPWPLPFPWILDKGTRGTGEGLPRETEAREGPDPFPVLAGLVKRTDFE